MLFALTLITTVIQPVPCSAAYGDNILGTSTLASGSLSWGYSDNASCLNGYPNIGDVNANSLTTSKYAIENQHNILSVNASVYTFSITVTGNATYDGEYVIRMFDTLGNETSTGTTVIRAGTSRTISLKFYPKNLLVPITLSISGRNTTAINGCSGPVFSNPQLVESAPPPKLSNTWMTSISLYDNAPTSFNLVLYHQAIQACAIGYAYLIYISNPDGYLVLYRTVKLTPAQAAGDQKFLITGMKPRTYYYIKAMAYGDLVNCLDSDLPGSWPNWKTPGPATLSTPIAPTLTNNSDNSINVSLSSAVPGASDYLFSLYASDSKTIITSQLVSTGIVGGSTLITGLKYGTTYYGGLVAKSDGVNYESSALGPLTAITTSLYSDTTFSDSQCDLSPSVPSAVVKVSAPSGYCIARIESNTAVTIPAGVTKVDLLLVGGGGGGGAWVGGGGGGGEVVTNLNLSVSGNVAVSVGAGGAGGKYTTGSSFAGTSGGTTTFGAISALGGGYGANWNIYAQGADSASSTIANGGGGSGSTYFAGGVGVVRTGGSGISTGLAPYPAGGGAGAGANGGSALLNTVNSVGDRYCSSLGGNGGNGLRDTNGISGSTANYFGGGGGGGIHGYVVDNVYLDYCSGLAGIGGLGGGGDGLTPESNPYGVQTGYSGKVNTGGGGGGVGHTNAIASYGGAGGSGVVYVRWSKSIVSGLSISLSAPVSTTTYQSRVLFTANLVGSEAKITFFQNGKRIPGCIGVRSSSLIATCSWKASVRNSVAITAIATQLVGNSTATSSPAVISVTKRVTFR